jgi:hypothetical protein
MCVSIHACMTPKPKLGAPLDPPIDTHNRPTPHTQEEVRRWLDGRREACDALCRQTTGDKCLDRASKVRESNEEGWLGGGWVFALCGQMTRGLERWMERVGGWMDEGREGGREGGVTHNLIAKQRTNQPTNDNPLNNPIIK